MSDGTGHEGARWSHRHGEVPLEVPHNLIDAADPVRCAWIAALPAVVDELCARWSLELGPPFQPGGRTSWVAPARSEALGDVVLKVVCRHDEALDEANGLREWAGNGVVELVDAWDGDHSTSALLLERCRPGSSLSQVDDERQDEVIAALLRRLWKPPPFHPDFRPLEQMCDAWADALERKTEDVVVADDPGLVRQGVELFRSLPRDGSRAVLLCTDLHADNVLAAQREPWLVVDPLPSVGDPAYDVLQHLLNCEDRLVADPLSLVARLADLLDLDAGRVRCWLFARCVIELPDRPHLLSVVRRVAPP